MTTVTMKNQPLYLSLSLSLFFFGSAQVEKFIVTVVTTATFGRKDKASPR